MNLKYGQPDFAELDFSNAVEQNRRRQFYLRKPKSVGHLINDIITRRGIAAEQSVHNMQNAWEAAAGMDIANQTRVASMRRGVLEIIVSHSGLLQLISLEQDSLLQKINQQLPKAEITRLRLRVGSLS